MDKEKHRPWPSGVCFIDAGMVQYLKISHGSLSKERVKKNIIGSSAFDKFNTCPVHEKYFQESRRGHFFSLINSICKSPQAGSLSREIRSMPGRSALTALTQQGVGSPSQHPEEQSAIKTCRKEEIELNLFADDVMVCIENSRNLFKKKNLELMNEFREVGGYKINV